MINRIDLTGNDPSKMEVIAVADIATRQPVKGSRDAQGIGSGGGPGDGVVAPQPQQTELAFEVGAVERAIFAKVVQKCGNRRHWEDWAVDIARIAQTHITRIATIIAAPANTAEREAFNAFAEELRDDLNNSISDDEIIEMLAQHLITRPQAERVSQLLARRSRALGEA
jgi:predicted helicase